MLDDAPAPLSRPLFSKHDFQEAAFTALLGAVALLPSRLWMPLCRPISRVTLRVSPGRTSMLRDVLPDFVPALMRRGSPHEVLVETEAARNRERVQALRSQVPGGWRPELSLEGAEHLRAALENGHGALLWVSQFGSHHLVVKRALARAGIRVAHVTLMDRQSRFGARVMFRIQARVEDRYLRGRIWLTSPGPGRPSSNFAALRAIRAELEANRVVSSTVADTARQLSWVPFFDGVIGLPSALPNLASGVGAPLIPVFIRESGPDRFRVILEAPLNLTSSPNKSTAVAAGLRSYAALLEGYVRAEPGRWLGPWSYRREPAGRAGHAAGTGSS